MDPTPLVTELENVSFNISIVSLVALVRRVCLTGVNPEILVTQKGARKDVKNTRK